MPYTQWTEEVYKDIARATWEVGKLSPDQVGNIMSKLHDIGHTFSADALRYVSFFIPFYYSESALVAM